MNNALKDSISIIGSSQLRYKQLITYYDEQYQLAWYYMNSAPRPCFTPTLLEEINCFHREITDEIDKPHGRKIHYLALASDVSGVFNLGGDLNLFKELILQKNRDGLRKYASACIDALYTNIINLDREITTISLVQGDALGGGFEAALSSDVLIAERSAKMGFPEILFNLFPGMGAYSLLSRKLDSARAERMILSGKLYTAEELYEMGVVDVLAEDLRGEMAVYDYIRKENKSANGHRAFRAAKNCINPITYDELMSIAKVWVNAALRLESRDLRMMERLVTRQSTVKQNNTRQQAVVNS